MNENGKSCVFPVVHPGHPDSRLVDGALTKREYLAGLAMQGMIDSASVFQTINASGQLSPEQVRAEFSKHCVDMADALLAALEGGAE